MGVRVDGNQLIMPRPRSFGWLGGALEVWLTQGHPGSIRPRVRAGVYIEVVTPRYDHPTRSNRLLASS
jgi:hypothetical protein